MENNYKNLAYNLIRVEKDVRRPQTNMARIWLESALMSGRLYALIVDISLLLEYLFFYQFYFWTSYTHNEQIVQYNECKDKKRKEKQKGVRTFQVDILRNYSWYSYFSATESIVCNYRDRD